MVRWMQRYTAEYPLQWSGKVPKRPTSRNPTKAVASKAATRAMARWLVEFATADLDQPGKAWGFESLMLDLDLPDAGLFEVGPLEDGYDHAIAEGREERIRTVGKP